MERNDSWNEGKTEGTKDHLVKMKAFSPAACWLWLAITSMLFMGIYAFLVALSRVPALNLLFTDQNFFKTALVTHVVLSVVIWFLSFYLFVTYQTTSKFRTSTIEYIPIIGAFVGAALIIATPFTGPAYPILNNYIPVLNRGIYFVGLSIFFCSVSFGILLRFGILWRQQKVIQGGSLIVSGSLFSAGVCLLVAILLFLISYFRIETSLVGSGTIYFEMLFWDGGHVLQFVNTFAAMAVWTMLSHQAYSLTPISNHFAAPLLILITTAVMITPLEGLLNTVEFADGRNFFLEHKQWMVSIGPIAIGIGLLRTCKSQTLDNIASSGLWVSLALFALGGVMAFTILGQDTRVPAHYHGAIGSVTLCFMTYAMLISIQNGWLSPKPKWKIVQIYLYGFGQGLFVAGLFVGGYAGLPRKTFGVEQNLDTAIKYTSMGIMGIGGLLAVTGGVIFVVMMIRAFLNSRTSRLE